MRHILFVLAFGAILQSCRKTDYASFDQFTFYGAKKYKWVYSRINKPWNNDLEFTQDTTLTPNSESMNIELEFLDQSHGHISALIRVNGKIVTLYDFIQFDTQDVSSSFETIVTVYTLYENDTSVHWSLCSSSGVSNPNLYFFNTEFPFKWTESNHVYNFYEKVEE